MDALGRSVEFSVQGDEVGPRYLRVQLYLTHTLSLSLFLSVSYLCLTH